MSKGNLKIVITQPSFFMFIDLGKLSCQKSAIHFTVGAHRYFVGNEWQRNN